MYCTMERLAAIPVATLLMSAQKVVPRTFKYISEAVKVGKHICAEEEPLMTLYDEICIFAVKIDIGGCPGIALL